MRHRQSSPAPRRAVVLAAFATDRPRAVAGTKGDSAMLGTSNVSVARIERRRIWAYLSNVGNTAKMVSDEVVAPATWQSLITVVADGMAVAVFSIDIAYSTEANGVTRFMRSAKEVAEPVHKHGVPTSTAAVDA